MTDTLKQAIDLVKQLEQSELRALYEAIMPRLFKMEREQKEAIEGML